MTEFVVAASFVMVPLFIIVPTVGKYIDMKLTTVEAARYASWEYTANYVDLRDQPDGFKGISQSQLPKKSKTQVINETKRRFFSDSATLLSSSVDKQGYNAAERNRLWTYHNGLPMYDEGKGEALAIAGSIGTPDKLRVVSGVIGTIGTITGFFGDLLQAIGINVGFDAINPDRDMSVDGLYTANLSIPVEEAPGYLTMRNERNNIFGQDLNLIMTAKSGILTESWGAGGKQHTVFQAGGLIPTSLLSGGVVQTVLDIISFIAPSLHSSSLKFGYPVNDPDLMDQVPAGQDGTDKGALLNDSREVLCPGGKCENY